MPLPEMGPIPLAGIQGQKRIQAANKEAKNH
jgi:hypothetical protein